jgi:hypothetical protein
MNVLEIKIKQARGVTKADRKSLIETGCAIEKEELNCYFKSYLKRESF